MVKRELEFSGSGDVERVRRELEFSGSGDVERVLRELFRALSGRDVPSEATRTDEVAYQDKTYEYRTERGDGLTAIECLDYGEYHHMWSYKLVVEDEVTVDVFANWRQPTFTFHVSATDIDAVTQTLIRIATAAGFTHVR